MSGSFAFCATDPRVPRLMFQTHFGPTIPGISEFMAEVAKLRSALAAMPVETLIATNRLPGPPT